MKKLTQLITSAKLNQKITLFVIVILAIPVIVFSIVIFEFLRDDQIRNKLEDTKINMAKSQNMIQKNVEMCNMSTQVFLNAKPLMQFVIDMRGETKLETKQVLAFCKSEVTNLEKIANSNPYLYQIRIYVDAKKSIEIMPILYSYDRLKRLEWAKNGDFESGTWQFDYKDTIFPETVKVAMPHIVSLVTKVNDFEHGEIGVIEVATKMELLFPDMYSSDKDNWCAFIDNKGKVYYDPKLRGTWEDQVDHLLAKIKKTGKESYYELAELKENHVIVACEYIRVLDGYLLKIVSVEEDVSNINRLRDVFVFILVVGFGMVTLLISHSIRALLRRLYEVISAVNLIGEGNLSTRVPVSGDDEVGHLGKQINLMLEYMTKLMKQGIQKERLIKDTEIKALQNQINAHFIYNVLESIKMMAEIKEQYDISDALTSLGKLLRYTMKWGNQFITVGEEIEYIKNYLALINLRFDYRIILSINMSQDILVQQIPKMSLQPIIENAIYHGIEELAEDTTIYIKGLAKDESCDIEIMDSGIGMSEEQVTDLRRKIAGEIETKGSSGNGLGLKNVQDRIVMGFGKEYGISIVSREKCYTKVIVKIPYMASKGGK